jgi:hypothetical protein
VFGNEPFPNEPGNSEKRKQSQHRKMQTAEHQNLVHWNEQGGGDEWPDNLLPRPNQDKHADDKNHDQNRRVQYRVGNASSEFEILRLQGSTPLVAKGQRSFQLAGKHLVAKRSELRGHVRICILFAL